MYQQGGEEWDILLKILKAGAVSLSERKQGAILEEGLDWNVLYHMMIYHRVLPLITRQPFAISSLGVPEEEFKKIKNKLLFNAVLNLHVVSTLLDIMALCKKNDVLIYPFKGPVLSMLAYGDETLRIIGDLDVLISAKDVIKVKTILQNHGYRAKQILNEDQLSKYIRHEDHLEFFHEKKEVWIDLHWDACARYALLPLGVEDIIGDAFILEIAGEKVPSMSIEDTVVHHCVHASSHCWERLEYVTCLLCLLKKNEGLDWEKVRQRVHSMRCKRMVLLGLSLCQHMYGLELPETEEQCVGNDLGVQRYTALIEKNLRTCSADSISKRFSWRFSLLHFSIRDSFWDSFSYCLRMLFSPTVKEWQGWPLSSKFSFLYYIYRPFRLFKDGIKMVFFGNERTKVS